MLLSGLDTAQPARGGGVGEGPEIPCHLAKVSTRRGYTARAWHKIAGRVGLARRGRLATESGTVGNR